MARVPKKLSGAVLVLAALIGIYGAVDGNLREQTDRRCGDFLENRNGSDLVFVPAGL